MYNTAFKNPLIYLCHNIYTIHERLHPQVDWDALRSATKKSPPRQLRWAIRLVSKYLTIVKLMTKIGSCYLQHSPETVELSLKTSLTYSSVTKETKYGKNSKRLF